MKSALIFILLVVYVSLKEECDKGNNPTQCRTCKGSQCSSCNFIDYLKEGKCYNCYEKMFGCMYCKSEAECDNCDNDGFTKKGGECVLTQSVIPGCDLIKPTNLSQCEICILRHYLSDDKTKCEKCPFDNCDFCNSTQCTGCFDSFYLNGTKCLPCFENCTDCEDETGKCTYCKDGFILSNDTCLKCNESCKLCEKGNPNQCSECYPGYTLSKDKKCIKCEVENCKTCVSGETKKCLECNQKYGIIEDNSKCVACLDNNCIKCVANNKSISNIEQKCSNCSDGFYLNSTECRKCNVSNCKECYQSRPEECRICSDEFYLEKGETTCNKCSDKFPNCLQCDRYHCLSCKKGYINKGQRCYHFNYFYPFCIEFNDNGICTKCEKGFNLYSTSFCVSTIPHCIKFDDKGCILCEKRYKLNPKNICEYSYSGYIKNCILMVIFVLLFILNI